MLHFQSCPHCAAFWLMHTWQRLHLVHRRASHVRLDLLYVANKCVPVLVIGQRGRKKEEKRERES